MPVHIPVLRPLLPSAAAIEPYLHRIDETRWYSNFGPMEAALRQRLAEMAGLETGNAALFSTGTAALSVALRAAVGGRAGVCLAPAWTHVGTASAIASAGLTPRFIDCDRATWMIEPEELERASGIRLSEVSAVVPVVAFGAPFDYGRWSRFSLETGIPVVIDGAASFDQFVSSGRDVPWGAPPVMVSLHATKIFGVGEGGLLLGGSTDLIRSAQRLGNFGIYEDTVDEAFGNLKMSEYSAAVGLAFLDMWPERRSAVAALASHMKSQLDSMGILSNPGFGETFVSSTCLISVPGLSADVLARELSEENIGVRRWWRDGVHALACFHDRDQSPLKLAHTDELAGSFLGVPFYPDMENATLDRVSHVLERIRRKSVSRASGRRTPARPGLALP